MLPFFIGLNIDLSSVGIVFIHYEHDARMSILNIKFKVKLHTLHISPLCKICICKLYT